MILLLVFTVAAVLAAAIVLLNLAGAARPSPGVQPISAPTSSRVTW